MTAKQKIYVFDTSVFIHDPHALEEFEDNHLVIPIAVVEELDKLKKENYTARETLRLLDTFCEQGDINKGVSLPEGGTIRVDVRLKDSPSNKLSADDRIIETALKIKQESDPDAPVIIVSKDTSVRIKAEAQKVKAQDYKSDKTTLFQDYGKVHYGASDYSNGIESVRYRIEGDRIFRLFGKDSQTPVGRRERLYGLSFKNLEQECAADALISDDISMVALTGKAGAGKTLLALAAGLHLYEKKKVEQVIVARPVIPMGKDLGYLPGDIEEKLNPWMQPIFDNLEVLVYTPREEKDSKKVKYNNVKYLIDSGVVHIEPLTYIRGRSLPRRYMIIDEAQNLRPIDTLTIATRAGEGTRIVFTGDLTQIDSPYLDSESNGLAFLISRYINEPDFCYLNLSKSARSKLAERASELLKLR
ncbi:MAG: PhoH family protein [Nitrospirae bacterium]|nr:PhoH family protein [Nitrospirota bacterium]